jgi:hypothetical protein
MSTNARSLASATQIGELRTSGVSFDAGSGERRTLRMELVQASDVRLQTAFGSVRAASVELSGVTVALAAPQREQVPAVTIADVLVRDAGIEATRAPLPTADGAPKAWRLDPLASLDGTLHAAITDAAWIFDADVTIPIAHGRIDFDRVTVEHVGPDSSMGISPQGVYVDAPNGRKYLFLLEATDVPGATFERRGIGLTSWSDERGSIDLQPLLECVLSGRALFTPASGARDMISRTRVRGELRLGDGTIGRERTRVVLAGRERGSNRVELSSASSGGGIVLRVPALQIEALRSEAFGTVASFATMSAELSVQIDGAPAAPRMSASIAELRLRDVRIGDDPAGGAAGAH